MIYEELTNKILIEAVIQSPGQRKVGKLKDEAAFRKQMTDQGYTFEPYVADQSSRDIWDHDPLYPKRSCEEAYEVLQTAFMRLGAAFHGLSTFMRNRLNFVCNDPRIQSAAIDESGNFYFNSDFIVKLGEHSLGEVCGLLMHEVGHIGMADLDRSKVFCKTKGDHKRWNIASDYVNNWFIKNDLTNMNSQRTSTLTASGATKDPIYIALPSGGLEPDDDGIIRKLNISETESLVFPPDKQIDLNDLSTEVVYEKLKEMDDIIIDHMEEQRFDAHIPQVSIDAEETVVMGPGGSGPPPTVGNVIPANLDRVLVIDKRTGQPGIVITDHEDTKSVSVVLLTDDQYRELLDDMGIDPADLPRVNIT